MAHRPKKMGLPCRESGPSCAGGLAIFALAVTVLLGTQPVWSEDREACRSEVLEYALSPDGTKMAEVIASEGASGSVERVVYGGLDQVAERPIPLFRGIGISQLKWMNRTTIVFVQNGSRGHLLGEDVRNHRITRMVDAPSPIMGVQPSPDGQSILYAFRQNPREGHWISKTVSDDLSVGAVALPQWATRSSLGSDLSLGRTTVAEWPSHRVGIRYSTRRNVTQLAWLPRVSGQTPVVLQLTSSHSPWQRSLIELASGRQVVSGHTLEFAPLIAISGSGRVAAVSTGPEDGEFPSIKRFGLYVVGAHGALWRVPLQGALAKSLAWVSGLWWIGKSKLLADAAVSDSPGGSEDQRLLEVDWRTGAIVKSIEWPTGSLEDCRINGDRTIAVCRAEELTESGQLVSVNLKSGRVTRLASSPGCIRQVHLSFRELAVRNRYGQRSTGFLALPNHAERIAAGTVRAVPLAVMMYSFHRTFAGDGEWVGVYPVSKLVSAGIGVLMLNFPRAKPWPRGDFMAAQRGMLDGPVATAEAAPAAVAATGVKIGRVMVMGWSWGGFVASHVIQDSCRFVAAEVGDPAAYNETSYAIYNATWRGYANALFGGPPDTQYIKNYVAFDPEGSGAPPKGPIMLEFVSRNLDAGQYLEEWRAAGADVEAFAYHFSPHVLTVPAEASVSRKRNLLWAEVNLLPEHGPTATELAAVGLTAPPSTAYRCH
jgi:hypothetical protein